MQGRRLLCHYKPVHEVLRGFWHSVCLSPNITAEYRPSAFITLYSLLCLVSVCLRLCVLDSRLHSPITSAHNAESTQAPTQAALCLWLRRRESGQICQICGLSLRSYIKSAFALRTHNLLVFFFLHEHQFKTSRHFPRRGLVVTALVTTQILVTVKQ